jgi:hypothetical protein
MAGSTPANHCQKLQILRAMSKGRSLSIDPSKVTMRLAESGSDEVI